MGRLRTNERSKSIAIRLAIALHLWRMLIIILDHSALNVPELVSLYRSIQPPHILPTVIGGAAVLAILQMLEDHERARWFWSTIGIAIKWIVSVGTATAILIATMKWGFEGLAKWRP